MWAEMCRWFTNLLNCVNGFDCVNCCSVIERCMNSSFVPFSKKFLCRGRGVYTAKLWKQWKKITSLKLQYILNCIHKTVHISLLKSKLKNTKNYKWYNFWMKPHNRIDVMTGRQQINKYTNIAKFSSSSGLLWDEGSLELIIVHLTTNNHCSLRHISNDSIHLNACQKYIHFETTH